MVNKTKKELTTYYCIGERSINFNNVFNDLPKEKKDELINCIIKYNEYENFSMISDKLTFKTEFDKYSNYLKDHLFDYHYLDNQLSIIQNIILMRTFYSINIIQPYNLWEFNNHKFIQIIKTMTIDYGHIFMILRKKKIDIYNPPEISNELENLINKFNKQIYIFGKNYDSQCGCFFIQIKSRTNYFEFNKEYIKNKLDNIYDIKMIILNDITSCIELYQLIDKIFID